MRLTAAGVTVVLGGATIIDGVDLEVRPGEVVGLLGPNGSGKSTLLRCAYRALRPRVGVVDLGGSDVWELEAKAAARQVAVVVQESGAEFDLTVDDVVSLGRLPHKGLLERDGPGDAARVRTAMERVGLEAFAHRSYPTLSGGEKQRVLLARALVQETPMLILDEPTNHLDIRHQLDTLDLIRESGLTTLTALHDLNLAAAYCDRLYVLDRGGVVIGGTPEEVLRADLLAAVFGVGITPLRNPVTDRLHIAFHSLPVGPAAASAPTARTSSTSATLG